MDEIDTMPKGKKQKLSKGSSSKEGGEPSGKGKDPNITIDEDVKAKNDFLKSTKCLKLRFGKFLDEVESQMAKWEIATKKNQLGHANPKLASK
eukprot:9232839-Alexandrium_andersonii.AAC.1